MKKAVSAFTALMIAAIFSVNAFADAALPYERAAESAAGLAVILLPAAAVIAVIVISAVIIKKKKAKNFQAAKGASENTEDKTEDEQL